MPDYVSAVTLPRRDMRVHFARHLRRGAICIVFEMRPSAEAITGSCEKVTLWPTADW